MKLPWSKPILSIDERNTILQKIVYPGITFAITGQYGVKVYSDILEVETRRAGTRMSDYNIYSKTEQDFVKQIWWCVNNELAHEAGEWFTYDGTKPFYPHERK